MRTLTHENNIFFDGLANLFGEIFNSEAYSNFQNKISKYTKITDDHERAHAIIKDTFGKKFRRDKKSTNYDHMMEVANEINSFGDPELTIIAMLHDTIEDSIFRIEDLKTMGFSDRVINAVKALSREPNEKYMDYIKRVCTNEDARLVKQADIRINIEYGNMKPHREFFLYPFANAYLHAVRGLKDGELLPDVREFAISNKEYIAPNMPLKDYTDYIFGYSSANDNLPKQQQQTLAAA